MPEESDQVLPKVMTAVNEYLQNRRSVILVHSADWYHETFQSCGNWDSWIWETVTGRDYGTRDKHFDGFIVYGEKLGRANAGIVDLALRSDRVVLAMREAQLDIVTGVVALDTEDMVSGWTLTYAQREAIS
jgi:hypothetical protein